MPGWFYIVECIAVPCAVGGVMFVVFSAWDRARRRRKADDGLPSVDYLI